MHGETVKLMKRTEKSSCICTWYIILCVILQQKYTILHIYLSWSITLSYGATAVLLYFACDKYLLEYSNTRWTL